MSESNSLGLVSVVMLAKLASQLLGSFLIADCCPGTGTVCKFGVSMRFSLREVRVIYVWKWLNCCWPAIPPVCSCPLILHHHEYIVILVCG